MNFLLAPRKEKDNKYPSRLLCIYCRRVFRDQCALGVHVRVVHGDEIKFENSRRALSLSGSYYSPHSTVRPLLAMSIGRQARARISGQTFCDKGSSSSDLSQPPTSVGSGSGNPSSFPEGHQEPGHTMPSFAASPCYFGPAGGRFYGGGSSSSLQPPDVTGHRPVPGVYDGCGPNRADMMNGYIPMTSPPLGVGPDQYEAEVPLMRRPIEENYYQWKNSSKTSTLKTPSSMPSEDSTTTSSPSHPPSPGCSNPTKESASGKGEPGDPSASGKEEDREDLDLTLHL